MCLYIYVLIDSVGTEANLKEAQTSRAEAETAMAEATALREKEADMYI